MTDLQARRVAMNLAGQLPADPTGRRQVMQYLAMLIPFLDGEDELTRARERQRA